MTRAWVLDSGGAGRGACRAACSTSSWRGPAARRVPDGLDGASAGGYAAGRRGDGHRAHGDEGWVRWGHPEHRRPLPTGRGRRARCRQAGSGGTCTRRCATSWGRRVMPCSTRVPARRLLVFTARRPAPRRPGHRPRRPRAPARRGRHPEAAEGAEVPAADLRESTRSSSPRPCPSTSAPTTCARSRAPTTTTRSRPPARCRSRWAGAVACAAPVPATVRRARTTRARSS